MDPLEHINASREVDWQVGDRILFNGGSHASGRGYDRDALGRIVAIRRGHGYPLVLSLDRNPRARVFALPQEVTNGLPPLTTLEQVEDFLEVKF